MKPDFWYWQYQFYPAEGGEEKCCSKLAIAFHYISPSQMYVLDFFAYKLKVFGVKWFGLLFFLISFVVFKSTNYSQ